MSVFNTLEILYFCLFKTNSTKLYKSIYTIAYLRRDKNYDEQLYSCVIDYS